MKILHTIDTTGPGGAETVFINLATAMRKQGHESIAVIRGKGWVYDQLIDRGFNPIIINMKGSFDLGYLKQLIGIIKTHSVDIVQSHLLGSNVYCSLAGLLTKVPVVSTFHGFVDVRSKERFKWLKFQLINKGSRRIVFVSKFLKDGFSQSSNLDLSKSVVIYNGIDSTLFQSETGSGYVRKKLKLSDSDIIVGSIGNIRPAKGYDILLDAASLIKRRHPNIKFVIIGQGGNRLHEELLRKQRELGLNDTVFFEGFQSNISLYLKDFDVFLLSSSSEGFSISTIEAMAAKTPVVVTASGGPEEIIQNEVNGLVVDLNSPDAIAEGIVKLIANIELRDSMALTAYQDCQKKFSLPAMLNSYSNLYESLLD